MRSSTLVLMATLIAMPIGAHGADQALANVGAAFGNSLLTIDPDGRSRKIWLKPDGTWTGSDRCGLVENRREQGVP